jgi:hypothetical protein
MESGILRAIIVYNVFLPLHFLLLPRTAIIALLLHLGVITPAIFAVGWLYRVLHRQVLREAAAAIIPWLMVVQIMLIYSLNRRVERDVQQIFLSRLRDQLRREGAEEVASGHCRADRRP